MILHCQRAAVLEHFGPFGGDGASKWSMRDRRQQNTVEALKGATIRCVHPLLGCDLRSFLRETGERNQNTCANHEWPGLHISPPEVRPDYNKSCGPMPFRAHLWRRFNLPTKCSKNSASLSEDGELSRCFSTILTW